MNWILNTLESDIPREEGTPFPRTFRNNIEVICKKLFRIYAHMYYSHFEQMKKLEIDTRLNSSFRHFYLFIKEFRLVDPQSMDPLKDLIEKIESAMNS